MLLYHARNRARRLRVSGLRLLPALAALTAVIAFSVPGTAAAGTAGSSVQTFPTSSSELPLSPGCKFVQSTVPSSVLNHQVVPLPIGNILQPPTFTIQGRLCMPPGGETPKTVMLALHGITYTNQYWDVGYKPETYSFARRAMSAGYAVYAIDRLGYGLSSHPLGALVTLDSQAAVAHNLIGQLRSGKIAGTKFSHVLLVGHSYGSATSWLESSEYNDADAVIATGWASDIQALPLVRFFSGFMPAQLDPKTAPRVGADVTYLTGEPGGRNQNFLYDLSNVDPSMINYDQNVLRDTVTAGEGATFLNRYSDIPLGQYFPMTSDEVKVPLPTGISQKIHIPMFLIDGASDLFFCGVDTKDCSSSQALQLKEAPYFAPDACERAAVTPHAGHDLNLHRNAQFTFDSILQYADQVLGPDGSNYAQYRATCQGFSGTNNTAGPATFGVI